MKSDLVQQITLYKYRYIAGFGALLLFILAVTTWRFWALPDGLSVNEMAAATTAGHFSLPQILSEVVNLPWTILEWLSIKVFGASVFAFRLPAIILMILSAGGLVMLLRKWSRDNIAVISGFLTITSVFFISLSRSATPLAMTTFLIVMILLSTLTIIRAVEKFGSGGEKNQVRRSWRTFLAKIILCIALALLCYQAAGIYLVVMFVVVGVFHPKTRLIFVKSKPWKIIIGASAGLAVMTPLAVGLIAGGSTTLTKWLVLNGAWSPEHLSTSWATLFGLEIGFADGLVTPLLTLVSLIIALLGLMKIGAGILSARAYLVLPFLLTTLALSAWQPELVYLLFVPLALLTTVGVETLVREWYNLFPRNPYARILGVVTLTILIGGLVWASMTRFSLSQNYDTRVVDNYNQEYSAVRSVLLGERNAVMLIVSPDEQEFYEILRSDFPKLEVSTKMKKDVHSIVLGSASVQSEEIPSKIVTSWRSENAVLLRIY
ncbi:glycosyltransferase family 39 protein [Candidatus Saccharibacteria bacterium]|nr:glycosyltransferase family 39 protein [Candidatus Saccharibacteria bacterium]